MNNVDVRDKDQCIYTVEVQQGGNFIASYTVEAPDALAAINRVELLYGQPLIVEKTAIEDQEGDKHRFTLAHNWHGYMFQARAIESIVKTIDWRLEIRGETLTPVPA
jgi:hypothetical protein